jgi:adenosylcobinamide kinase/adenosylcobinamide-phosphate guanylyltransferase
MPAGTRSKPPSPCPAIADHSRADTILLVDCLTLWASNLLLAGADVTAAAMALYAAIAAAPGKITLVSNEVGLGIVPDNALARQFRDAAGRPNQGVATAVDQVHFVAVGLTLRMK